MKYISITLVAVVLLCSGCATRPRKVWFREGLTQQAFSGDKAKCNVMAGQSVNGSGLTGLPYSIARSTVFRQCMEGKGYILTQGTAQLY
jgi:hypothetical protein